MVTPHSISVLISAVLGQGLAIPFNICIVIVNLKSLRKKGKLSPSDGIFMAKAIVNLLLQALMNLQGVLFAFYPTILYSRDIYPFLNTSNNFLTYYSFWLTAWLSVHYCTSITNLSHGLFIWMKRIVSNFLSRILFLTALGVFVVTAPSVWALDEVSAVQASDNNINRTNILRLRVSFSYYIPVNILGCILPFCLSLLCLLLTFSFLLRHVWRVKNNDSGSTRPNLQAPITALRTIFLFLLIMTFFCISQILLFIRKSPNLTEIIPVISWNFRLLSPLAEVAVIFQASNKLKKIMRRSWMRRGRSSET